MATGTNTRRLAAILAADVAGFSRLMGADEEGTHERLKAHLAEVVEPKIREHRGRIVKTAGDGVLADFASVVDAVRCAREIQGAMADRDLDLAEERRLRFRIGVNLGDVIADGDDIYGDGVNIAARLEGLAEPGGICVSGTVRDHIGERLPYAFDDMGEQSVKNIARPVRAYALRPEGAAAPSRLELPARSSRLGRAIIGAAAAVALVFAFLAWWLWPAIKPASAPAAPAVTSIAQPSPSPRLSIVVLPFTNLSNDPDQQYFADGVTEDLTTDLSRIANSVVISRNTAFTYRNKPVDTKQIGRELDVRYVLEGSVRRSGSKVRVNAQLIAAETDAHLWADQFDGEVSDLFALQNEIASRIAIALNLELTSREAARPSGNPDALDYNLRGRAAYWKPNSREKWAETIGLFEHALAMDQHSVEAQAWLANALVARATDGLSDSPSADMRRAEELVGDAIAAAPRNWFAHYAKGGIRRFQGRCEEAIPEFNTALTLNPNWTNSLDWLAWCKLMTGSIEEAIPLEEQAIRLSPEDPYRNNFYYHMGIANLFLSRPNEAIVWFEKARSSASGFPYSFLAAIYGLKGDTEKAAANLAEVRRLYPDGRYLSIARRKARGVGGPPGYWGVPKVAALFEATYFAGLRKAGMPEE
jgi:TolB-like protein/class 3 adenylate cyclase